MAERVVKVRLEAITSGYKRAMDEASRATSGLVEKAGGMEKLGGSMSRVGGIMTKSVTAPLVLAGGAAAKMAIDFESSFGKITGLVGVAQEDIGELKDGVMSLAGETAKSPQELADALFTVTSAGFRGAEAMGVLEMAAKASAAGMGETNTIAQALTGAINAYGPEVLDAAKATDILVGTARAGNFETSQLAGSLGLATPMAVQAKISFADLGGAVALLTRRNNNASASLTQITALARAFVVPTEEAKKVLGELGMTAGDVRESMGQNGLAATLQDLDQRLGGNREQLGKLLGSSEAAAAAFQILDASAEEIGETFGAVNDSTGVLDNAFGEMAETAGFKNKQAFAELQVALIQVGDILIPIIANVAEFAATMIQAFSSLPEPAQKVVVALAGILAATGPVLSISGKLMTNWGSLSKVFRSGGDEAAGLAGKLSLVKMAAAGIIGVAVVSTINAWRSEMQDAKSDAEDFVEAFTAGSVRPVENLSELHDELLRVGGAAAEMKRRGDEALNPFLKSRFREAEEGLNATRDALLETESAAAELQRGLGISADEAVRMATNTDTMTEALDPATGELDVNAVALADQESAAEDAAEAQKEFEESIKRVTSAIRSQLDPLFAAQDSMLNHKEAQDAVKAAQMEALVASQKLDAAIKEHGKKSDEAALAALNLEAAQVKVKEADDAVVRSALDVAAASAELKLRVDDGSVSLEAAEDQLRLWVEQGLITAEQAYRTAEQLRGVASQADVLANTGPIVISVSADTTAFDTQWNRIARTVVEGADGTVRTKVTSNIMRKTGGPIPGGRNTPVPITAHGGEFVLSADVVDAIKNGRPTAGLGSLGGSGSSTSSVDQSRSIGEQHIHFHGKDAPDPVAALAWAVA